MRKSQQPRHRRPSKHPFFSVLIVLVIFISGGTTWYILTHQPASATSTTAATSTRIQESTTSSSQQPKLSEKDQQLVDKMVSELEANKFIGVAYVRRGNQILLDQGFGFANKEKGILNQSTMYYQIGSVQKAITTALILQQVQKKSLSLEDKLSKFYPQIPGSEKISIRDMLYMRSGLHREASPSTPMFDDEVVNFAINHLTFNEKMYHVYKYEPLNFTLLAGILEKITETDYADLFNQHIKDPLRLEHSGFYDKLKDSPLHATSYQMTATDDYAEPLIEPENNITNELGTGNITMTAADLDTFFRDMFQGKVVDRALLDSLWKNNLKGAPYNGGVYSGNGYIKAQGNINRFQSDLWMTRDGKTSIILQTNIQPDEKLRDTMQIYRERMINDLTQAEHIPYK